MTGKRIVHIIGTGTIGEPLIGLFCSLKDAFGIDEVTFHKRTPLADERAKVNSMMRKGAKLVVDEHRINDFETLGHKVHCTADEAIGRADVVIDCTPCGNDNKAHYMAIDGPKAYLAQGSEYGFGQMYARGLNDEILDLNNRFTHIVSCNTHNICVLIKSLASKQNGEVGLNEGRFVCMRRATDISQATQFIPAPEVGGHKDPRFGTHHARDAWGIFNTLGKDLNLFSSALKLPTQYMHTLQFMLDLEEPTSLEAVMGNLNENPRIAITEKMSAGLVFSFGRDHGYYGRILNEAVVPHKTLHVSEDGKRITGFCYTPQDGNSLLSSMAATLWYMYGEDPQSRLQALWPYMFQEI
jgi:glyceraldehyde-3-phosphate dehydrogenase (NAD(P))